MSKSSPPQDSTQRLQQRLPQRGINSHKPHDCSNPVSPCSQFKFQQNLSDDTRAGGRQRKRPRALDKATSTRPSDWHSQRDFHRKSTCRPCKTICNEQKFRTQDSTQRLQQGVPQRGINSHKPRDRSTQSLQPVQIPTKLLDDTRAGRRQRKRPRALHKATSTPALGLAFSTRLPQEKHLSTVQNHLQ